MEESVFMDGVRGVFAVIDRGVYALITTFYNLIESLTSFTIIGTDKIAEISGKIYALIALFMIFKISFSLINYLVNPDLMVDKTKGGGALVKNIIITFALIVIVPFGFDLLYQAQSAILSDALVEKLIYGDMSTDGKMSFTLDDECGDIKAETNNIGDYVALMAFKPFFQLSDESLVANPEDFHGKDGEGGIKEMYCKASVNGGNASVKNLLATNKVYSAPHGWSTEKFYVVDYTIFLSTIIGVVLALIFLSFCFDVATRTIKLQFLELLAPVPIISYIDPDKSKNGMFSKWLKEVGATWISLFMRLFAFHIAIYFISLFKDVDVEGDSLWFRLLIIIGILMFAKELPKLLENIMGIKMSGSFSLNPLKKIGDNALGGKALVGLGAGAVGAVGGGIAGFRAGVHAGAPMRGTALGMLSGFSNGKGDPKKAFSNGMNKTYKSLTGNEMSTMTPSRMLMGVGQTGNNKVQEIKDHLKTARGRMNKAQTRLNTLSYHNSQTSEKLRNIGINPDNITENKDMLLNQKNDMFNKLQEVATNRSNLIQRRDSTTNAAELETINKQLKDIEKEYSIASNNYNVAQYKYDYVSTLAEEEKLRGEISKIEKEISTLGDEKKQRETFWQVDTSPKTSVEEAMKNNPRS